MAVKGKRKATYKQKSTMTTGHKPAAKVKKMEKVKSADKSKAKKAKLKTKGK